MNCTICGARGPTVNGRCMDCCASDFVDVRKMRELIDALTKERDEALADAREMAKEWDREGQGCTICAFCEASAIGYTPNDVKHDASCLYLKYAKEGG